MSVASPPVTEELHIVSLVVHSMPALIGAVGDAIVELPDARIHGSDVSGKLVVTLEATSSAVILDQIAAIQHMHGVINVAMVYQHTESLESLNTEMAHDCHPT